MCRSVLKDDFVFSYSLLILFAVCRRGQIAESQSLIGGLEDLRSLEKEFADDEVYLAKIKASHV